MSELSTEKKNCKRDLIVEELKQRTWYNLCINDWQIYPLYYSSIDRTNSTLPEDKYITHADIPQGTNFFLIRGEKRIERKEEAKEKKSISNRIKSMIRKDLPEKKLSIIEESVLINQIHAFVERCNIFAPPRSVSEYYDIINTLTSITLDEDLIIFPDYSNTDTNILTTKDLYGIVISKGSEIVMRQDSHNRSVNIVIIKGKVIVNCRYDVTIPGCKEIEDPSNLIEG